MSTTKPTTAIPKEEYPLNPGCFDGFIHKMDLTVSPFVSNLLVRLPLETENDGLYAPTYDRDQSRFKRVPKTDHNSTEYRLRVDADGRGIFTGKVLDVFAQAISKCNKSENFFISQVVSRLLALVYLITSGVLRLIDFGFGLLSFIFAIVCFGYCISLNNLAYRGFQLPGILVDIVYGLALFFYPKAKLEEPLEIQINKAIHTLRNELDKAVDEKTKYLDVANVQFESNKTQIGALNNYLEDERNKILETNMDNVIQQVNGLKTTLESSIISEHYQCLVTKLDTLQNLLNEFKIQVKTKLE